MHIAWLKSEFLHPLDKGGRIRSYHLLRALSSRHRVTYLALDDGAAAPDAEQLAREYAARTISIPHRAPTRRSPGFFSALAGNAFSSLPYAIARYRSKPMERALVELLQRDRPDVVVADFLAMAPNVPTRLPVATVLFQHNVESEIWRRHADNADHPLKAAYFRTQWRRMAQFEAASCRRFGHTVAVSQADAELLRRDFGAERVSVVQTGVDTEYFQPSGDEKRDPLTLVFTGSMDWMPNEEGIHFFVREVLPLLRREVPRARVQIVGRRPGPALRRLAADVPGVEVIGDVPDIRPYLAQASAAVVPLRVGGGTRLKIYEAMAMECAVISTSIGAEGLPVTDGEHFLRADSATELSAACVRLLKDRSEAARLAGRAAAHVRTHFAWASVANGFVDACESAQATARHSSLPAARIS